MARLLNATRRYVAYLGYLLRPSGIYIEALIILVLLPVPILTLSSPLSFSHQLPCSVVCQGHGIQRSFSAHKARVQDPLSTRNRD